MCGICRKLQLDQEERVDPELIDRMMETLPHRGPDGRGKCLEGPLAGHTRLAIIDLNTGAQPLPNEDKTVWIVFNGEIYNYLQLREDLRKRGHVRSRSDTESYCSPLRGIWRGEPSASSGHVRFGDLG